jgi:putative membrane protein
MGDVVGQGSDKPDARTYFAAERTLLAWIRTGLAMMGFGFVVARFGLFLQELAAVPGAPQIHRSGLSLWIGTLLVFFGVVVNVGASIKHYSTIQRLERGEILKFSPLSFGLIVGLSLAMIGLMMVAYLVLGLAH